MYANWRFLEKCQEGATGARVECLLTIYSIKPHGPKTLLMNIHRPRYISIFHYRNQSEIYLQCPKECCQVISRRVGAKKKSAGIFCRKSDFILKTLSRTYSLRESVLSERFFMARHVLLTSQKHSFFCMRRRRRIMGREKQNLRRRWTNRSRRKM